MSPELWCVIGADHLAVDLNAAGEPHLHLQPAEAAPSAVMVRVLQRVSSPNQCVIVMPAACAEIGHQLVATHVPFKAMLMLADDDAPIPEGFVRAPPDADTATLKRTLSADTDPPASTQPAPPGQDAASSAAAPVPQAPPEPEPAPPINGHDPPDAPPSEPDYDPAAYDSGDYSEQPPATAAPSVITMPPPNLDADPLTWLLDDSGSSDAQPDESDGSAVPDAAAVARAMTGSEVVPDPLFESGQFDDDDDDYEIPADPPSSASPEQSQQAAPTTDTGPALAAGPTPASASDASPASDPDADEDPLISLLESGPVPASPQVQRAPVDPPPFPRSSPPPTPSAEQPERPDAAAAETTAPAHEPEPQQRPEIHQEVLPSTPRIPPAAAVESSPAAPPTAPASPEAPPQAPAAPSAGPQPATASPRTSATPATQTRHPADLLDMTPGDEWRLPAQDYRGPLGRVVAVLASKGGIGKTTLTLWVTEAMKTKHDRVCVVDANLDNSDIAYLAGAYRKSPGLAGLIGPKPPTDAQIEEALLPVEGLGHLLSGPQFRTTQSQAAAARTLRYVIGYLRTRFEWVFIDLPVAGADTTMLTDFALRFGMIDLYMAVFTTENPDIRSVSSWFKEQQLPPERGGSSLDLKKCVAIINKSDGTQVDPAGLQEQITKKLKMTVAGHVPLVPTLGARRNDQVWRCPPEAQQGIAEFCYNAFKVNFGAAVGTGGSSDERRGRFWRRNRRARTVT